MYVMTQDARLYLKIQKPGWYRGLDLIRPLFIKGRFFVSENNEKEIWKMNMEAIKAEIQEALALVEDAKQLADFWAKYFGKGGEIQKLMAGIK